MSKKQKPKRKKTASGNYKKGGLKPKKGYNFTSKDMLRSRIIDDYLEWLVGKYTPEAEAVERLYNSWKKLTYSKDSDKYQNALKFLDWFNYQRSKNLKVYAFEREYFVEYKVKEAKQIEVAPNLYCVIVELRERKGKKYNTPAFLSFTNFDKEENYMVVYNQNRIAFNMEKEVIETKKVVEKTKIVKQEIKGGISNKTKKKIKNFITSKELEKCYKEKPFVVLQELLEKNILNLI